MEIRFYSVCCKSLDSEGLKPHSDFKLEAYHRCMEWSDFSETPAFPKLDEHRWERSSIYPVLNEIRLIKVSFPFRTDSNNPFWSFYKPTNLPTNDWENNPFELEPDLITVSAFLRCKLLDVVQSNDFAAWVRVQVIEIISLAEATSRTQTVFSDVNYSFNSESNASNLHLYHGDWQLHGWNGGGILVIGAW